MECEWLKKYIKGKFGNDKHNNTCFILINMSNHITSHIAVEPDVEAKLVWLIHTS